MSTPQPNRCRPQLKFCACGSPTKSCRTTLFPTTSQRMQIEHRAGVMEYPKPKSDYKPILSATTEKILQLRRELKKHNEHQDENVARDNDSVSDEEETKSVSSSQERNGNEQLDDLQAALDEERNEKELLQAKLHKLAEITRNLVDAMSKCKEILGDEMIEEAERCLDDI